MSAFFSEKRVYIGNVRKELSNQYSLKKGDKV